MKKILMIILIILIYNSYAFYEDANWYGESTAQCVVLLKTEERTGVGFLISLKDYDNWIVVTCKHVLKDIDNINVVFNLNPSLLEHVDKNNLKSLNFEGDTWELYNDCAMTRIKLDENKTYVTSDKGLDIAAFFIKAPPLVLEAKHIPERYFGNESMLRMGEDVYFIGFPMGLGVKSSISPLLRTGIISWVSNEENEFLIDAFSYPGNSGSPVFTKMSHLSTNRNKPYLVGMVKSHLEAKESKDNIGLANCVSIIEIRLLLNKLKNMITIRDRDNKN